MTATAPPTRRVTEQVAPSARPWFGGLEAIRFGAAFVVLLHHAGYATGATYRWSENGAVPGQLIARLDIGVTVFFVLSGFVLFRPYVDDQFSGRTAPATVPFWIRRAGRIFPAYWAALLIQLAIGVVAVSGIGGFLATFFLAQTYFPETVLQGITQAWTLCAELGFYLLLPGLAAVARRWSTGRDVVRQATRLLVFCAVVVASSVVARVVAFELFPRSESRIGEMSLLWTPAHLDAFGAGMALAVVSSWASHQRMVGDTFERLSRHVWAWWAAAAGVFWFVSTQLDLAVGLDLSSLEREILRQTLYVVVSVAVLTPIIGSARIRSGPDAGPASGDGPDDRPAVLRFLERPALVWLGSLTYAIYLWHQAVISWTLDLFGWQVVVEGDFFVVVAVATAGSIAIAVLSRRLVEDPAQRLVRRWLGRPAASTVSAGTAS